MAAVVEEDIAGISGNRRAIVNTQNRILGQTEFEQQPAAMSILRNVRNAQFAPRPRIPMGDVCVLQSRSRRKAGRDQLAPPAPQLILFAHCLQHRQYLRSRRRALRTKLCRRAWCRLDRH